MIPERKAIVVDRYTEIGRKEVLQHMALCLRSEVRQITFPCNRTFFVSGSG